MRAVPWLLCSLALLMTGCQTSPAAAPSTAGEGRPVPPVNAVLYGVEEVDRAVNAAQELLVQKCMRRLGFTYAINPTIDVSEVDRPQLFGLESLARKQGSPAKAATPETPQGEAYGRALFGEESTRISVTGADGVFVSRPGNGCLAQAEERLVGDQRRRQIELRLQLASVETEAENRLYQDEEFRRVHGAWQDCMSDAGFELTSPLQVFADLRPGQDVATLPVAQADIGCKEQQRYLDVAYSRLAAAQHTLLDARPGLIEEWRTLLERKLRAARTVLGAGA